jgi:hypothetical protein
MTFQRGGNPKEMMNIGYSKRDLLIRYFLYKAQRDYLTYFIYELANDRIYQIDDECHNSSMSELFPDAKNLSDEGPFDFTFEEIDWIVQEMNKLTGSIRKIAESELEISIKKEKKFEKAAIKAYTVRNNQSSKIKDAAS